MIEDQIVGRQRVLAPNAVQVLVGTNQNLTFADSRSTRENLSVVGQFIGRDLLALAIRIHDESLAVAFGVVNLSAGNDR